MSIAYLRRHLSNRIVQHIHDLSLDKLFVPLTLGSIGLDIGNFQSLRLSYNNLPIDSHFPEASSLHPTRFRRYSNFRVEIEPKHVYHIYQNDNNQFSQCVSDFRQQPRIFQPMQNHILDDYFMELLTSVVYLTYLREPLTKKYNVSVHQVRLLSYPHLTSDNAPEGIHQDGVDYIVSALVLNKHNIHSDTSIIYDKDKQEIYRKNLEVGEFIFQEDHELWHDITPIQAVDGYLGYRDILGFDIQVLE